MSKQQGTGLPGSGQGLGSTKGRRNNPDQMDQKLTDDWKSPREQGGSRELDGETGRDNLPLSDRDA
jgi:hypothetical protein